MHKIKSKANTLIDLKQNGFPVVETIILEKMPQDDEWGELWKNLKDKKPLAIRSSSFEEDGKVKSMAGKFDSVIGIETFQSFKDSVVQVFKKMNQKGVCMIQRMIISRVSGVMFTSNPTKRENNEEIIIESHYGLGELLVSGQIIPDRYTLRGEKWTKEISENKHFALLPKVKNAKKGEMFYLGEKKFRLVTNLEAKSLASIPYKTRTSSSLNENELGELKKLASRLETFFGCPQDIEWAYEEDRLIVLQSRPITKFHTELFHKEQDTRKFNENKTLEGIGVSPGIIKGKVGSEVLVVYETKPEMIYEITHAKAIVTEIGGMLCHAAIVAREYGIPCVVGVRDITKKTKENDEIVVNGSKGEVILC